VIFHLYNEYFFDKKIVRIVCIGDINVTYTYDSEGLRIAKTVNDSLNTYIFAVKILLQGIEGIIMMLRRGSTICKVDTICETP